MTESGYILSEKDRNTLNRMHSHIKRWEAIEGRGDALPQQTDVGCRWFLAEVTEAGGIGAATDVDTPAFGSVKLKRLWLPTGGIATDPEREIIDALNSAGTVVEIPTAYNLSETATYEENDRCLVCMLSTGLHILFPISIASGGGGGGACGCTCIDNGDIEVDGIETTSQWSVTLPDIEDRQVYGTILLPGNTHILEWDETDGYWSKDIGAELTATFADGSDATDSIVLEGTLVFYKSDSGRTKLVLTITGTVPEEPTELSAYDAGYADGFAEGYADGLVGSSAYSPAYTSIPILYDDSDSASDGGDDSIMSTGPLEESYIQGWYAGYYAGYAAGEVASSSS